MSKKKKVNQPNQIDKRLANLKPQSHVLTVEEQSKGGLASVKARREKKILREDLLKYFGTALGASNYNEMIANFGERLKEANVQDMTFLRDTLGQKPAIEVNAEVKQDIVYMSGDINADN